MNNSYVIKVLNVWRERALKAEKRVKYLENLLKEHNVRYEQRNT